MKPLLLSLVAAFAAGAGPAFAADTLSGHPTAAEAPLVAKVSADLQARFATVAAATRAGYVRFTDEDDTGAISYADLEWTSKDPMHPSQLWYDVNGRLLGADFSVLQADSPTAPSLWGVDPKRWITFNAHVHYGLIGPNHTTIYGGTGARKLGEAAVAHPTASDLVAAGIAKSTSDVRFVFAFPAIWDLEVWVLPNPNGAFAQKNPNVVPVHPPKSSSM